MGYNDSETSVSNLIEAGVLSTWRPDEELYVDVTYVAYNYADTEVYNRKLRFLTGKELSLSNEYSIFNNLLTQDFSSKIGFIQNDKKELKFNSDNLLERVVDYVDNQVLSSHLDIKYSGTLVIGYLLEGNYYSVIQDQGISGHLLTERGYIMTDYWDDTTYENVLTDYNQTLYADNNYVALDYSDWEYMRNDTLEVNGLYGTSDWYTNPGFITPVLQNAFSYSEDADEFIHVIYNPDLPNVNKFYLGDTGPLQFNIVNNATDKQPYIDHIKVFDFNKKMIKRQYVMYYGGIINGVADSTKIHHVDITDGDRKVKSTLNYTYDINGNIISITEVF